MLHQTPETRETMSVCAIRTYRPRRSSTAPFLISGVVERCRLCLSHSDTLHPIFDNNNSITLTTRIFTCLSVQVVQSKHLPVNICNHCQTELNRYYEFKKKCQINDNKLKSHMQAAQYAERTHRAPLPSPEEKESIEKVSKENVTFIKQPSDPTSPYPASKKPTHEVSTTSTISNFKTSSSVKQDVETHVGALIRTTLVRFGGARGASRRAALQFTPGGVRTMQLCTRDSCLLTLQLEEEQPEEDCNERVVHLPTGASLLTPNTPVAPISSSDVFSTDVTFSDLSNLATGKTSHRNGKGGHCEYCGKRFATGSALLRHRRTHTGERPFSCATCSRSFTQKEVLQRHLLVHLEKRPFACGSCDKSFTQREALRVHTASHLPPASRPLRLRTCPLCPKVFCHSSGLTRHMKMHGGHYFTCALCDRHFTDQSALRRHSLLRHGDIKSIVPPPDNIKFHVQAPDDNMSCLQTHDNTKSDVRPLGDASANVQP